MADANQWIDTVIAKAAELRKAGVSTITVDGCSVTLHAAQEQAPIGPDSKPVEPDPDPLFSAATYPNGIVPGFTREGQL